MAQESKENKSSESKPKSYKLKAIGPKENSNGPHLLRFHRDGKKDPISIVQGQLLTVSSDNGDLTKTEAERIQQSTTWNFERVNN